MPKYNVMYEVVESYDATIDVESLHNLTDFIEHGHWNEEIDRSWRGSMVRVVNIWRDDDEG